MDEKTPHMHFLHVPVTPDGRLNANKIYTRQSLRKLQSELPAYLQSRGFVIERGVEQTPGSAKKHLDTREFKQQQEALEKLIQESEETTRNSRQLISSLKQREEELRKSIDEYERQAEEAEMVLREDSSLPKASLFNYPSVLEKASSIIGELKKALAVKHLVQKQKENLQQEVETLRQKQILLEAEYTAHRKHNHEEKEELETQLRKMKRIMAGYREISASAGNPSAAYRVRGAQACRTAPTAAGRGTAAAGAGGAGQGASAGALRPWHENEVRRREGIFAQAEDIAHYASLT